MPSYFLHLRIRNKECKVVGFTLSIDVYNIYFHTIIIIFNKYKKPITKIIITIIMDHFLFTISELPNNTKIIVFTFLEVFTLIYIILC